MSPVSVAFPLQNGTTLRNAVAGITDAGPNKPYLVKVEPGVYALGVNSLELPTFVHLEGSGRENTRITGTGTSGSNSVGTIVVNGVSDIRQLSVENYGGGTAEHTVAIRFKGNGSIEDVDALAYQATNTDRAIVFDDDADARVDDATITARASFPPVDSTKYGVQITGGSSVDLSDVRVNVIGDGGNYGISALAAFVRVYQSEILAQSGTNYGLYFFDAGLWLRSSTVTAIFGEGYGLYLDSAGPATNPIRIDHSSLLVQQPGLLTAAGIYATAGAGTYSVHVQGSRLAAFTNTIRGDAEYTFRVGASQLEGGAVNANGGTITCAGVYTESYTFFASTCP